MNFEDRITGLREQKGRTSFEFHFSALFTEQEWVDLPLEQRKSLEREFRVFVENNDHIRIPFASEDHIRMRMYNSLYEYNEVKHNFKAYV